MTTFLQFPYLTGSIKSWVLKTSLSITYRLYPLDLMSRDMQNMINGSLFGRYIKPMMSGNQVQSEMQNE